MELRLSSFHHSNVPGFHLFSIPLFRHIQRPWQGLDEGFDFVADAAVGGEGFVVGLGFFGEARGIVEADVDDFGFAGEERARFAGVVADGDDEVEVARGEVGDGL